MSHETAAREYEKRYGVKPQWVTVAPGRVNLIGEHTDYNEGFVFPAAINFEIEVAAGPTDGPSELFSTGPGEGAPFRVAEVKPGDVRGWSRYVAGMAWALRTEGHPVKTNIRAVVSSNLPMGSGVSSSAAMEMVFGVLWNAADDLGLDNKQLALLGVKCENEFVGMKCGVMDQMASAMGRAGKAMFLDTRTLEIRYAPIPEGLQVVLCDTTKARALAGSKYNERRAECESAAKTIGVKALRDASLEQLEAAKGQMTDVVYRRARHVVTEDQRCLDFIEALERGDLAAVGTLMHDSHVSLRDDYEVSCPELDAMAEAAWAAPGCVGARMTGAGFGGACVALVRSEQVEAFIEATRRGFTAKHDLKPKFLSCEPAEGARVLG